MMSQTAASDAVPAKDLSAGSGRALGIFTAIWALLVWRGFPFPFVDDPFYIGAGLNIGAGGGLRNPLLEGMRDFYGYPPLHSFVVGSWLRVFGISAASMVALYAVMAWAATWCVYRAFRVLGRPLLAWLAALDLVIYCTCYGVRPDVCGMFLVAISFRLGVSRGKARLLGPLFALLAVAALPAAMAIAFPWIVCLLAADRRMWKALLAAGVAVALLNIALIDGRIHDFITGFFGNESGAGSIQMNWVKATWYLPMGLIKIVYPILVIPVLAGWAVIKRGARAVDAAALMAVALGFYVTCKSTSGHRIAGLISVIAIGCYLYLLLPKSRLRGFLVLANGLLIILSGLRPMLEGVSTRHTTDGAALLSQVQSLHPARMLVDEWSLRYVFDYRLAPGMIAIDWSTRPGGTGPVLTAKYPDECWVLSADSVGHYRLPPHGLPQPRGVTLGGRQLGRWVGNAGEIGVSAPGQ